MKVPKTFVPEKNLEKKTKEFRESYRKVTPEELKENSWQIIHGDATIEQRIENIENITSKIVNDTLEKNIIWKEHYMKDPLFSKCYKTKIVIPNYKKTL